MIITAEHDYTHVKKSAQKGFNELTGQRNQNQEMDIYGSFASGTARSWQEIPKAAHVSLIYNDAAYTFN